MIQNLLGGAVSELTQKLQYIDPSELQSMLEIPNFDAFTSQFTNMLPQNLINIDPQGILQQLNPTNMLNTLSETAQQALPQITQQLISQLQGVAGGIPSQVLSIVQNTDLNQLGSQLQQIAQNFSSISSDQLVGLLEQNFNTGQFSNLLQAAQGGLENLNFSPKMIRDLANPQVLATQAQQLTQVAQNQLSNVASTMANAVASNPVYANTGQNNLQQLSAPRFSGENKDGYQLAARLTSYWAKGPSTDTDTAAYRSSTGRRLQAGISCAVDPSVIPYGSRVEIPGVGTRLATDTGGAVKGRVASGGRLPIIDIFYDSFLQAQAAGTDTETVVTVYPPSTKYKYVKNSPPTYGFV